jgi:hypothetical protein
MAERLLLGVGVHQANQIRLILSPRTSEVMKSHSTTAEVCTEASAEHVEDDPLSPNTACRASLSMQSASTDDDRPPKSDD